MRTFGRTVFMFEDWTKPSYCHIFLFLLRRSFFLKSTFVEGQVFITFYASPTRSHRQQRYDASTTLCANNGSAYILCRCVCVCVCVCVCMCVCVRERERERERDSSTLTASTGFPATKAKQVALEREVVRMCLLQSLQVWCKRNCCCWLNCTVAMMMLCFL